MAMRVAELFSGIGGMHCGLKLWEEMRREENDPLKFEVIIAMDFSQTALEVYHHNFPSVKVSSKSITAQPVDFWRSLKADLWMMSPPCQPYTRQGLKKHGQDRRADSLTHLLDVLKELSISDRPRFILLENVQGFEESDIRQLTVKTLQKCKYEVREFLLTPVHFGIPNFRQRYFLTARRFYNESTFDGSSLWKTSRPTTESPSDSIPRFIPGFDKPDLWCCPILPIQAFLDRDLPPLNPIAAKSLEQLILSKDTKQKSWRSLEIVRPRDRHSCCFTKSYGKYFAKTGSVLLTNETAFDWNRREYEGQPRSGPVEMKSYLDPQAAELRLFSATEVLQLHCFPNWFSFPGSMTTERPKLMLLGNSLNVRIVSFLCGFLLDAIPNFSSIAQRT